MIHFILYIINIIYRALLRNFGKMMFKKLGKNNARGSFLSEHLIGIPNVAGIHGALYGTWLCDAPGVVQGQSPKSSNHLRA